MHRLFSPATALMNRLGYTTKFTLLWLMSFAAIVVLIDSFHETGSKLLRTSRLEVQGLAVIEPISRAVQLLQLRRGLAVARLSGYGALQETLDTNSRELTEMFTTIEGKLTPPLAAGEDWRSIRNQWRQILATEPGPTVADSFAVHNRLVSEMLLFKVKVADQYELTLDPQFDTYYLIDTTINKLPEVLEHLGQLRAYGIRILERKQATQDELGALHGMIAMLRDGLGSLDANLGKVQHHNPSTTQALASVGGAIQNSVQSITERVHSDILSGVFSTLPMDYYALASEAIDKAYSQVYETLLPTTERLLVQRIAQAERDLYLSIGFASFLILVVAYFAVGIYYATVGNIQSLARSARVFADGDLSVRVNLDTRDELRQVGQSFNTMADGFGALLDARRQVEETLNRFKSTLDQTHDCVFMFSPDSLKFSYANRGATLQVGYTAEELLDMTPLDIKPDFDAASFARLIAPLLAGTQPGITFETVHRHKDGHLIPVEVALQLIGRGESDARFIAIVRDITERRRAASELERNYEELKALNAKLHETQDHLLQSEKMASIGQLAAGVAHEINNPIGYVNSNLGTLEKYVQDALDMISAYEEAEDSISDAGVRERLRAARKALDIDFLKEDLHALMAESKDGITRVKRIVQDLKDFSRVDATDEWQLANLHAGLDSTLNIVNNELKYKATVVKEYGRLPEVECQLSKLNQVFMNLLVNASHAIEERGTITIRTGTQDGGVFVEIADTGHGIAPENLRRIFDPFFTTKPVGKGTGLGLSLSYSIIQKHQGRIEVGSEVGKGTTFRIWLPTTHDKAAPDA